MSQVGQGQQKNMCRQMNYQSQLSSLAAEDGKVEVSKISVRGPVSQKPYVKLITAYYGDLSDCKLKENFVMTQTTCKG